MKSEKNRSVIYIAIFVGLIMILSVVGFLWGGGEGSADYKYNDFLFNYNNGQWITNIDGRQISFSYLPEELLNISVPANVDFLISNARMIYLTYDPEKGSEALALTQYDFQRSIATNSRFVVNAFTKENENALPVVGCENATQFVPVIMLIEDDLSNSISLNNFCITLEGRTRMLAERLVYDSYGITD